YGSQAAFTGSLLEARLTILKLATGCNTSLVIRNRADNSELYRGDLLGTLLLKNPEVNLACDHDFTIRFTAKDQCRCGTYMITEIWVNNWLVHSYTTDL
ncbi:FimB/Mfa2 family fimbrial subunit, partial [Dysgonomonas termitidis]